MKAIVSIDIGTTSMRAILYDADGRRLHVDQRENAPDFFDDGRVEQDPAAWATLLVAVLASCAGAARGKADIAGVAVTAQRSSLIAVAADGRPLHPAIMWQDRRTAALAAAMDDCNALVYRRTGLKISPVFSALKMTWLRRERPEIWARTHKLIGIHDWVLHVLTGRFVTDHSLASRTNLFDLARRDWDAELLALFGVEPRMLCELAVPGAVVGGLTPALAAATGLPAGLPVVSAGGDQQCAALGLGLFAAGRAVSNTGTGSYLIAHAPRPVLDDKMRLACNVSAVPGAYIVEAAVLTSGTIYKWFAESLLGGGAGDAPAFTSFAALDAAAAATPPGAGDLLLLPHFKGAGSPYWDPQAKGVFYNVGLSTSRGEMARAILEAIAVELKGSVELIETLCGPIDSVAVAGGMSRSALFNQIEADVLDRPVVRYDDNEATSLGAWIAGAVALGMASDYPQAFARARAHAGSTIYRPNAANRSVYERQCRRSRALYEALAQPALRELLK